ncbi:hypothetical protein [Streptomyces sp. NPDC021356]
MRGRWKSGELTERRQIAGSVLVHCIVRPGVKGKQAWDFSRLAPVRR